MEKIPHHLRKYIVSQNYDKYTSIDQACWRFILRQLKDFLSQKAHDCYLDGLEKTGISIEEIPRIENISKNLEKFGWRALPVSGFIPPAAFMELQSLSVLPIASDMRTIGHLMYTPAPDIVHEAAGHAPILIHPEFAAYLKQYALVAKKAIISSEDLDLYEAIRELSDLKENPLSTEGEISQAQEKLNQISKNISHISEASELSRMNWWTAEYGLIGEINNPKIFGAGLLSSVGESKWGLSQKVKKIPLSADCLNFSYDITEPQPQLFVAKNFKDLSDVLEQMSSKMAFKLGGVSGLKKAKQAKTVNTIELDSGAQISGQLIDFQLDESNNIQFIKFQNECQICYKDQELENQGTKNHSQGFSSPLGLFKGYPQIDPSHLQESDLAALGMHIDSHCELNFSSGYMLVGRLTGYTKKENKIILLTFTNCTVKNQNEEKVFLPEWGVFDLVLGTKVTSVFGGPADRMKFGETEDFIAARVPNIQYSESEKNLHQLYQKVRNLRSDIKKNIADKISNLDVQAIEKHLNEVFDLHQKSYKEDWLLLMELYEILFHLKIDLKFHLKLNPNLEHNIRNQIEEKARSLVEQREFIFEGLRLAETTPI